MVGLWMNRSGTMMIVRLHILSFHRRSDHVSKGTSSPEARSWTGSLFDLHSGKRKDRCPKMAVFWALLPTNPCVAPSTFLKGCNLMVINKKYNLLSFSFGVFRCFWGNQFLAVEHFEATAIFSASIWLTPTSICAQQQRATLPCAGEASGNKFRGGYCAKGASIIWVY